jgi:hypothetical protein
MVGLTGTLFREETLNKSKVRSSRGDEALIGILQSEICNLQLTEAVFIETHERFAAAPTVQFASEANRLFGDQTYYATVDTSLSEPKRKVWEKRSSNGDEE